MRTRKLNSTDAFVVIDLEGAPLSAGVVRLAPKVLVDGATWLARSQTYQFAAFGRRASGASAGVNAGADGRAEAVTAFAEELGPDAVAGTLLVEAGKGLSAEDLAPLRTVDRRPAQWWDQGSELRAVGIAAAAGLALWSAPSTGVDPSGTSDGARPSATSSSSGGSRGSLEGRTVAVEGFDGSGPALVRALAAAGARVVALSTSSGSVVDPAGFDVAAIVQAWEAHGPAMVADLGEEAVGGGAVLAADAEVLLVGSKAGVLDHDAAAEVRARVVVPSGPIPVTAKALAVLRRAGVVVLPDFVTTAGHLAAWPDALEPAGRSNAPLAPSTPLAPEPALTGSAGLATAAAALVEGALAEVMAHPAGPVLGACELAEAFLRTWRDELPFGRPLA